MMSAWIRFAWKPVCLLVCLATFGVVSRAATQQTAQPAVWQQRVPVLKPALVHNGVTAQIPEVFYSVAHPAARMRGWWPVNSADQPKAQPGKCHVLFAQGNSWGGPPFFSLPDNIDSAQRVSALFSEFRRNGWSVWHVNYPGVPGSLGATLQGPAATWPEIPSLLAESVARVRSQYSADQVVVIGTSGGGVSWGSVATAPDGTYAGDWRPDGLVLLDAAPSITRLSLSVFLPGGPQYFGETNWLQVTDSDKAAASMLPNLAVGPAAHLPVVATFDRDDRLPQDMNEQQFLAAWDQDVPITGYVNPHQSAGGLGLTHDFVSNARPGRYRIHWGDGVVLNSGGLPGILNPGQKPMFAFNTRVFMELNLGVGH